MSKQLFLALGALALGTPLFPATTLAQEYAHEPFFEQTVPESQAFGFEMIGNKLSLAAKFPAPLDDELVEQLEGITGPDLARFFGTLQSRDPDLANELPEALEAVQDAASEGKDATGAIKTAQDLLAKAYTTVLPPDVQNEPSFKAGLMVNLLLAENGVSEGYEEAVENREPWEYPSGWAALQRVKQLWADLKPLGTPERQADGQEMIDALDKLFPDAGPPESVAGWNPEEAEDPAQRLSGIMEEVANSNLYPDRDLPRLSDHLAEVTGKACDAYGAGDDEIAAEDLFAVFDHYSSHISDTAGLFAPELQQKIAALFGSLIDAEDDDDDDEGAMAAAGDDQSVAAPDSDDKAAATVDDDEDKAAAGGDDDDKAASADDDNDDDDAAIQIPDSPVEACGELKQAFVDLKTAFGG